MMMERRRELMAKPYNLVLQFSEGSTADDWWMHATQSTAWQTKTMFDKNSVRTEMTLQTSLTYAFYPNSRLVKVERFPDTSEVTTMAGIFNTCTELVSVDLSGCRTDNVKDMGGMFYGDTKLETVILPLFNAAKVTNYGGIFGGCNALRRIVTNATYRDWLIKNASTVQLPTAFRTATYSGWEIVGGISF